MNITQATNPEESLIVGRNGTHKLHSINVWLGGNGKLFIDGIGKTGSVLNAGFALDYDAGQLLLAQLHAHVESVAQFEKSLVS